MTESLLTYLKSRGWEIVSRLEIPGRSAIFAELDAVPLSKFTRNLLRKLHPAGLYRHQVEAIAAFAAGRNVAITTGTASGKTTVFQAAAVEAIAREQIAKTLAIYPLRALTHEQSKRWQKALRLVVREGQCGRLDGSVDRSLRGEILRSSQVVVATPDVVHAWLLPSVGDPAVRRFLKALRLVVVDEAHSYTGVFGSNAAFMYRRLVHLAKLHGSTPRFVAASATISKPREHLRVLTGQEFDIIDDTRNGAEAFPLVIHLVNPPEASDLPTLIPELFAELARDESQRFIVFMDSRKQVELFTSIAARTQANEPLVEGDLANQVSELQDEEVPLLQDHLSHLERLSILPYRSGYEETDRKHIQQRLANGSLRGVIATSALELGIDVEGLNVAVLLGVPQSSTSFLQRIGRVGRHCPGDVIIINSGSLYDRAVFAHPETLLTRPPAESALYVENPRIQYIHALCLGRIGGEHDSAVGKKDLGVSDPIPLSFEWPMGFAELLDAERTGEIPVELQSIKLEAGDIPHLVFPLRDIDQQFNVSVRQGGEQHSLGSISYSQALREAYPGAVYRYAGRPFRVYNVNTRSKEIFVRKEKFYITTPNLLPTLVFPNLAPGNIFQLVEGNEFECVECRLHIREWLNGFTERRGPNQFHVEYPELNSRAAFYYPHATFARNYFTTGVVLFSPVIESSQGSRAAIARYLYEALLFCIPYERQDIGIADDKLRKAWANQPLGTRFMAIYDCTYGSLRLSSRLADPAVLREVTHTAMLMAQDEDEDSCVIAYLERLASSAKNCARKAVETDTRDPSRQISSDDPCSYRQIVIRPGSCGVHLHRNNEEFQVGRVYWNAKEGGIWYEGKCDSLLDPDAVIHVPKEYLAEIPGVTEFAIYDVERGTLLEYDP